MIMLLAGIALAACVIFIGVVTQVMKNNRRQARLRGLELKPNCLLTRYPIAFLSGPKTVFRFFDHWNDVPVYLREHGYEVLIIEPNGRTPAARAEATLKALSESGTRCHLIADASLEQEMEVIAERGLATLVSLTVVKNPNRKSSETKNEVSIFDLKPRKIALETFEIGRGKTDLASGLEAKFLADLGFDSSRPTLLELASRLLLKCHNFVLRRRARGKNAAPSAGVDALETAELGIFQGFRNEACFLTLAVSLAERDLTASD